MRKRTQKQRESTESGTAAQIAPMIILQEDNKTAEPLQRGGRCVSRRKRRERPQGMPSLCNFRKYAPRLALPTAPEVVSEIIAITNTCVAKADNFEMVPGWPVAHRQMSRLTG